MVTQLHLTHTPHSQTQADAPNSQPDIPHVTEFTSLTAELREQNLNSLMFGALATFPSCPVPARPAN